MTAMEADKNILLAKTAAFKDDVDSKDRIIVQVQAKITEEVTTNKDLTIKLQDLAIDKERLERELQGLTGTLDVAQRDLKTSKETLLEVSVISVGQILATHLMSLVFTSSSRMSNN